MNKHITTDNLKTIFPPIQYMIDKKAEGLDWNENDPSSKGYIKNRPFYTYEKLAEGKYLVPETTFTGVAPDGAPIYIAELSCDYDVIGEVAATPETWISTTFNVIYDGVTYQASGKIFEEDGMPYMGNSYVFTGDESANTGEPFIFIAEGVVAVFDGNEHTISIKLADSYEKVDVKIDTKYLPEVGLGRKGVGENAEVYNGGSPTQAEGAYSHVEGYNAIATGYCSHAEGYNAEASGYVSHVEGYQAIASGEYSHAEGSQSQATNKYSHAEGHKTQATGEGAHAEGGNNTAAGNYSHAEGAGSTVTGAYAHAEGGWHEIAGDYAHAEGNRNIASGYVSHAEGESTVAEGNYSHAEGYDTTASGNYSHAEGYVTHATGESSHTEGHQNTASGHSSHAEGQGTEAAGSYSHAEGYGTIASSPYQHVQGKYNIEDTEGKYAHIVGYGGYKGIYIKPANIHTLDWNGLGWFAGGLKIGGTGQDDPESEKIATETFVSIAKKNIAFIDEVNGLTYLVSMRNGSLVSSCATSSITVSTLPNKTNYIAGEYFDPAGMIVTATLCDNTTKEITDYIIPTIHLTEEDWEVEIAYIEAGVKHTTSIPISVAPFDPITVLADFNYTINENGTYHITGWKGTQNGENSTEIIIPNNGLVSL